MKNIKIIAAVLLASSWAYAQDASSQESELQRPAREWNRWSLEANAGPNKAIKPFAPAYYSADGNSYFNFSEINHFDVGVRYMFSTRFGLKLDYALDKVANQRGSGSLPFEVEQNRIALQGVANVARILSFETFTGRIGLLAHAGVQVASLEPKTGLYAGKAEQNGGIIVGLTPQLRIFRQLVLTADFTLLSNVRQHYNWDGSISDRQNNLTGQMYNTSLGLTWYFGRKEKHADWYVDAESSSENAALEARVGNIETFMNDTDKDGVPDYLDLQNNTPPGLAVDTKGRFIDANNNGTPDELEKTRPGRDGKDASGNVNTNSNDAISDFIEKGYLNLFYDVNKDEPNTGSTASVFAIIRYLKENPAGKVKLTGYADLRGDEAANLDLSKRRAQNLQALLAKSGIEASRIIIVGQGVDNSFPATPSGFNLARRVSVSLE